jgi:hypothetical protein
MMLLVGTIAWLLRGDLTPLILFLPGIIALPVFALVPSLGGRGVPLSLPTDAAKSAGRGLNMIIMMAITFGLAMLASSAWTQGWFWWLVLGESVVSVCLYCGMRLLLAKTRWPKSE